MNDGRIEQIATPEQLRSSARDAFRGGIPGRVPRPAAPLANIVANVVNLR